MQEVHLQLAMLLIMLSVIELFKTYHSKRDLGQGFFMQSKNDKPIRGGLIGLLRGRS